MWELVALLILGVGVLLSFGLCLREATTGRRPTAPAPHDGFAAVIAANLRPSNADLLRVASEQPATDKMARVVPAYRRWLAAQSRVQASRGQPLGAATRARISAVLQPQGPLLCPKCAGTRFDGPTYHGGRVAVAPRPLLGRSDCCLPWPANEHLSYRCTCGYTFAAPVRTAATADR